LQTSDVEIPTSFTSNLPGLAATQDYRVINSWGFDVNIPVPCASKYDVLTDLSLLHITTISHLNGGLFFIFHA
jgi:hypothetical protein